MRDSGTRTTTDDGGLATVPGVLVGGFQWIFGDLDRPDLRKLYGLFKRLRTTQPFLLVEDPAEGVAEGIHYCTFSRLEPWERRDSSKSRIMMGVEDGL